MWKIGPDLHLSNGEIGMALSPVKIFAKGLIFDWPPPKAIYVPRSAL